MGGCGVRGNDITPLLRTWMVARRKRVFVMRYVGGGECMCVCVCMSVHICLSVGV